MRTKHPSTSAHPCGAEQSRGAWWLGSFRNDPGRQTSLHVHHRMDEQFYGLEGAVSIGVDGGWHDFAPRSAGGGSAGDAPCALEPHQTAGAFLELRKSCRLRAVIRRYRDDRSPLGLWHREFFAELMTVYKKYDTEMLGRAPQS